MRSSGIVLVYLLGALAQSFARTDSEKSYVRRASLQNDDDNDKFQDGQARIVGGHDATKSRNPYMVSLWSEWRHECGAVIVAPDVLLTAAHCINNGITNSNLQVNKAILGRWNLRDINEDGSTVIRTSHQLMHDDYDSGTDEHDVGLMKLVSSTTLPAVRINSDSNLVSPGATLTTLGWGDLGNGTFPDKLQEVQVDLISNNACRNAPDALNLGASYQDYIYQDMMCAFDQGKDGCFGDSGGPLLQEGPTYQDDVVVGITSWGIGCARMPGVYARVAYHYDWIQENICLLSDNPPSYLGCDETEVGAPTPGSNKNDPFPTVEPTTEPSATPAPVVPPTRISNDVPPTNAYTLGVTIPPIFNHPSSTLEPTAQETSTDVEASVAPSAEPTPLPTLEQTPTQGRSSGNGAGDLAAGATSTTATSSGTVWTVCSSLLVLSTMLMLAIAF